MNYSRRQLEAFGEPFGESATRTKPGGRIYGQGGGGPQQSTVTQTNIPDWLRPQTETLMGAAMQEFFNVAKPGQINPETGKPFKGGEVLGIKPYTPYSTRPEDYVAGFSPLQQQVFSEAANMQRPAGFEAGTQMAGAAGQGGLESAGISYGYGQAGFGAGQRGEQLGVGRGGMFGELGAGYGAQAAGLSPQAQMYAAQAAGLAPQAQRYGQTAADIGQMGLRAESLGRDVGEEARQFARRAAGMGGRFEGMATDPYAVQAFMSPYQRAVTDVQKQSAMRDYDIQMQNLKSQAARTGAYGGSRQAIQAAEAQRNLNAQLQNIEALGQQSAYDKALQQMQFGTTTGLQGLAGAQTGLGTALQGGQLGLSGIGQAMAGQQAGLSGLGQASQLYGQGLAGLGQAGQLYGLGMQGAGVGLQGLQQQLAGTAQGMQGAQVGLQGVSGAQAGYNVANQAAMNLANIARMQQEADIARMGFQSQQGQTQRTREQDITNQAIQNYAMAQQYPAQQLAQYNALLRGYATPTTTVTQYQAPPSALSQIGGLGLTGAAMYGMMNKKAGGKIEDKDGIDDLLIRKTMKKVSA